MRLIFVHCSAWRPAARNRLSSFPDSKLPRLGCSKISGCANEILMNTEPEITPAPSIFHAKLGITRVAESLSNRGTSILHRQPGVCQDRGAATLPCACLVKAL